jgi:hypothetical protein
MSTVLLVFALLACAPDPVLPSVSAPGQGTDDARDGAPYKLAEGVIVDVQYLAGRTWESARDEVARQMGEVQSIEEIPRQEGRLVHLERGDVEIRDDRICRIKVTLPEPRRRSAALSAVGLPIHVANWMETHREYRLRWTWNFERIRMGREGPETEEVVWVEARRWDPRDPRFR